MMVKRFCTWCGRESWHNPSGKKDGSPRCTFCGHPPSTNPGKAEWQRALREKQASQRIAK